MSDIQIKISVGNNINIYGNLSTNKKQSKKLIIFIHGFLSNSEHSLMFNSAEYFNGNGFNTFRYNIYGSQKDTRKIESSSIKDWANDFNKIVSNFEKQNDEIILISHSLGAYVALLSKLRPISRMIFWEPSLHPKKMFECVNVEDDSYCFDLGYKVRMQKEEAEKTINIPSESSLLKKIKSPTFIMNAEKGGKKIGEDFYDKIKTTKERFVVEEADHNFSTVDAQQELFNKTLNWLNKKYS